MLKRVRAGLCVLFACFLFLFCAFPAGAETQNSPKIIGKVFEITREKFLHKSEADFPKMLKKMLNRLETKMDEVLVNWSKDENGFEIVAGQGKKSFTYREPQNWQEMERISNDVFSFVRLHADKEGGKTDTKIEYTMVNGILSTMDRHSHIIPPRDYEEFKVETEGSFTGLGIVISSRKGWITVISPIEDTPAYRAGMKAGDRIVQIENESTVNMSIIEAVNRLRGPKGEPVNIRIMRDSLDKPKPLTIVRDVIKIESVEDHLFPDGILYIKIKNFQRNTTESAIEALIKRRKETKITGIILDLRDNPGGLLEQAAKISDLFLRYGTVFSVKSGQRIRSHAASRLDRFELRGKTVVLINSGSASASEIVTGALKENDRALTMGTRTFGKGSVQDIFQLEDGSALKLTIANYLIPGDISIHKVGITPDIFIEEVDFSKNMAIYKTPEFAFHLEKYREDREDEDSENLQEPENPSYTFKILNESLADDEDKDKDKNKEEDLPKTLSKKEKLEKKAKDPLIKAARQIISEAQGVDRSDMLGTAETVLKKINREENKKITEKLAQFEVDWSNASEQKTMDLKPDLYAEITPDEAVFKAGQKAEITVRVKNRGNKPVYKLTAVTKSENSILSGREFIFGKISPGGEAKWKTSLKIPENAQTRNDECTLRFFDSSGTEIFSKAFTVGIERKEPPVISYNYEIVDDGRFDSKGNGDGRIASDEKIALLFKIKNTGKGTAEDLGIYLQNKSGKKLFLEKAIEEIGQMKPGESKDVVMRFRVEEWGKEEKPDKAEFDLLANDFQIGFSSKYEIKIPSHEAGVFADKKGVLNTDADTAILSGSFDGAKTVSIASAGSSYKFQGSVGEWSKVELGKNRAGWIKKTGQISFDSKEEPRPDFKFQLEGSPVISIDRHVTVTDKNEIDISGSVKDMEPVVNVSFFNNGDKIHIINSPRQKHDFSFTVPLENGINKLEIMAKDSTNLRSIRTFYIRKKS